MKTIFKVVFFVSLAMMVIQCEKSSVPQELEDSIMNIPFKLSNHNLDELIASGYNSDIVLLQQNTYLLAKSLLSIYEKNDYNNLIQETYTKYRIKSIPFSLLFENKELESVFNSQLDSYLINSTLKGVSNATSSNDLYSKFTVESNLQEPALHLINPDVADFSLKPIISPGLEVEDDSVQGIQDCIVAWFEDEAGEVHQIVIGENEALNSKWPVYVLSTIDKKDETKIVAGLFENTNLESLKSNRNIKKGTASIDRFCSYEYRLNYQFESLGNCEFCIVTFWVEDTGTGYETNWIYNDNNDFSKKIEDVKFSDIGKDLSRWEDFCPNLTPYPDIYVYFNTFERDWYSSKKNIGVIHFPYYNQPDLYLAVNLQSSSNWYANDKDIYSYNDRVDLADIESSWAEWYTSTNGHLRIWRVD